jgi:hypothetical protein
MLPIMVLLMAAADAPPAPSSIEEAGLRQLAGVRRVYVDRLTGGETAAQMHDILIAALDGSKLFILTENQERADAVLKGAAEDLVFSEQHQFSDGINAHVNAGTGRNSGGRYQGSSYNSTGSAYGGISLGENESEHSTERRHEAMAAVRLVNKEGDVIWSTTQESLGAKFRGASVDTAEKITAKLKEDFERARKLVR